MVEPQEDLRHASRSSGLSIVWRNEISVALPRLALISLALLTAFLSFPIDVSFVRMHRFEVHLEGTLCSSPWVLMG